MSWKDILGHVAGGLALSCLGIYGTLQAPISAVDTVLLIATFGALREQAQFQSDRITRRATWWENWTQWADRDALIEGPLAWGAGAALLHIPLAIWA